MATKITITEALQEIKTIGKRLERKRQSVLPYIVRDRKLVDPFEQNGGSVEFIKKERQAVKDLEKRVIEIRTAIQKTNLSESITLEGQTRTVAEWLTWRREVSPNAQMFLRTMSATLSNARVQLQQKGGKVVSAVSASIDASSGNTPEALVNLDEKALLDEQDLMEKIIGELDGKLSLFNATKTIELAA